MSHWCGRVRVLAIIPVLALAMAGSDAAPADVGSGKNCQDEVAAVLERIESKMARVNTLQTSFEQVKALSILEREVVIRGTISIQKPDFLAWHVQEPVRYSLVIKGDSIRQWDEDTNRVQKISLAKNPAMRAAMDQMRMWFTGEYSSMVGEYEVTLEEEAPARLRFIPRESFLQDLISSVVVSFRDEETYLQQIEIIETSGDKTTLIFIDPQLNAALDDDVWSVKPRGK